MRRARLFSMSGCLGGLAAFCAAMTPATAGQQKWASQYVNWQPDGPVSAALNLEQHVWIAKANRASYWPLQFGFNGMDHGGYMGLQQTDAREGQVRFSIWNATAAEGASCRPFDGEGVGQTCILPVKIEPEKLYRLRLSRLEAAADGQWWGGWLIEAGRDGALVEHRIGRIKAPAAAKSVNPNAIRNFVEYYGPSLASCRQVPLSIAAFFPPAMNDKAEPNGANPGHTRYAGSKRASGNRCASGKEPVGAAITATPYRLVSAEGVMVYIGGTPRQHVLDMRKIHVPKTLPRM